MKKLYVRNSDEDVTFKTLYDEFIIAKKCINVSSYTISYYERCFKSIGKYYDINKPCADIDISVINNYILALKERDDINNISINSNLGGVRAIMYYGMEHGYINRFRNQYNLNSFSPLFYKKCLYIF